MTEPFTWSTVEAARRIRAREISARDYVDVLLNRIRRLEPELRAWARLDAEGALAHAARLDEEAARGDWRGPLHGVAVGIKDNLDCAGLERNAGSALLAGHVSSADAEVVRRLRAAGAIVLGKTAMTAFAAMDPAPTANPWNAEHTPGGSSSGSAAAVAAQMCAAALGTQTAGSILRPAAYCGTVGLKPTYEAVSRQGLLPCAWSMDHVGPISRDVADVALMFGVMSGRSRSEGDAADAPPVIGVADRAFTTSDPDVAAAYDDALQVLAKAGARIIALTLPDGFEALAAAGIAIMYAEMAAYHRERYAAHAGEYPPRLAVLVEAGLKLTAADYVQAQRIRAAERAKLSALIETVTVLLTPTTATPAPMGHGSTGDWSFNLPFSASGHPALTLPCGFSASGLPIGVQAVAAHGREGCLFALGKLFQQSTDWHLQRPRSVN